MKLAINGGKPVREELFPAYKVIGSEEKKIVNDVLESGILSRFLGCWHKDFYGGPQVQAVEKEWATYFGVKHAITVNSCTSGLYCAVGAIGVEPGDEIITSPTTMSATATSALVFNAVPVFADIEPDLYCIDINSIKNRLTKKTKAIIAVDIFGQPYNSEEITQFAKENNLYVIEDCAQAPYAKYKDKFAGTISDIGVFSLNYHKHIHCGEGGIIVCNDDALAEKMRLIRNHAEAVVDDMGMKQLENMIGFNFRMTEIEAAITRCQLKKLKGVVEERRKNVAYLESILKDIPALEIPKVRDYCTHSYYLHTLKFNNQNSEGLDLRKYVQAVQAELPSTKLREEEGPLIFPSYCQPLYFQSMYQKKIAYGSKGFPFSLSEANYKEGLCPVAERIYNDGLITHELMRPGMERADLDDVASAFMKVWECRKELN